MLCQKHRLMVIKLILPQIPAQVKKSKKISRPFPSAPPALVSESDSNTDYVVRIFEGKIGVFTKDGTTPLQVLEVFVDTLPEQDQAVLETGITVTGRENLRKTLEDYES